MRSLFTLILVSFFSSIAFADEPIINQNVHVVKNAKPAQCPSSWRGTAGMDTIETASGYGQSNAATGATIQSCTGCAIDSQSGDCVCATCYQDYN